jgi:hypothetical protein
MRELGPGWVGGSVTDSCTYESGQAAQVHYTGNPGRFKGVSHRRDNYAALCSGHPWWHHSEIGDPGPSQPHDLIRL